jgi:uncharacterized protein (TIGR03435 family)
MRAHTLLRPCYRFVTAVAFGLGQNVITEMRDRLRLARGSSAALAVAGLCSALAVAAQAPSPGAPLSFDVASIKERDLREPLGMVGIQLTPGRVSSRCASLGALVFFAYDLTLSSSIRGLPDWGDTSCSDYSSKDTYEVQATMAPETTDVQARQMMQTLLGERFKLMVHWETRTLPIYSLVIAQGGFKLKPSDPKDVSRSVMECPTDDRNCHSFGGRPAQISVLAQLLSVSAGRPVVDRTGVTGTYRWDLTWAGDSAFSSLPSLPAALKERFGLELKADTAPLQVLVIDHAERPSAN